MPFVATGPSAGFVLSCALRGVLILHPEADQADSRENLEHSSLTILNWELVLVKLYSLYATYRESQLCLALRVLSKPLHVPVRHLCAGRSLFIDISTIDQPCKAVASLRDSYFFLFGPDAAALSSILQA